MSPAIVFIKNSAEAQKLQDYASSRCTITYRAPELFNVEVDATIDQRTDIWVCTLFLHGTFVLIYYKYFGLDYLYFR